jgi:hypothetical protein
MNQIEAAQVPEEHLLHPQPQLARRGLPIMLAIVLGSVLTTTTLSAYIYNRAFHHPTQSVALAELEHNAPRARAEADQLAAQIPTTPRVAGINDTSESENSSFQVIPADGARAYETCAPGVLFSIGTLTHDPMAHPALDFNWQGDLDLLTTYTNPFRIDRDVPSTFPWRTSEEYLDTLNTEIEFSYVGPPVVAELLLSWAPGKHGYKQKFVSLNQKPIGQTPRYTGDMQAGWWEQMERVKNTLPFTLEEGMHLLTIRHEQSMDADGSVWDAIELRSAECLDL